ncbi:MAG: transcriptional regulator [Firmicutes bacterium]|nr:transcriptional regulator [Bacillota bacterium]
MRELTFEGFLRCYVQSLSLHGTLNMRVLAREAETENPRLREPLVLYAVLCGKDHLLWREAADTLWVELYAEWAKKYDRESLPDALERGAEFPREFEKVWNSYKVQRDRCKFDNEKKNLIRSRVLSLCKEEGISNYRIYTDLNMNPGNVNAWLKHGNAEKVSLSAAREILKYVKHKTALGG